MAFLDPEMRTATAGLVTAGLVDGLYGTRPLEFNDNEALKVMVLMTDGANTLDRAMSTQYRTRTSDVWVDDNGSTNLWDDRYYVNDPEYQDTDGDGRWEERYWVSDWNSVSPGNEWWSNSRSGQRLTYQELWSRVSVQSAAWSLRADQYNDWNTFDAWYDDIIITTGVTSGPSPVKDARLDAICSAAKAEGIVIFTIGFNVDAHAAQVMSDCATSPNHFYRIADLDIDTAFNSIANQISALRLIR